MDALILSCSSPSLRVVMLSNGPSVQNWLCTELNGQVVGSSSFFLFFNSCHLRELRGSICVNKVFLEQTFSRGGGRDGCQVCVCVARSRVHSTGHTVTHTHTLKTSWCGTPQEMVKSSFLNERELPVSDAALHFDLLFIRSGCSVLVEHLQQQLKATGVAVF